MQENYLDMELDIGWLNTRRPGWRCWWWWQLFLLLSHVNQEVIAMVDARLSQNPVEHGIDMRIHKRNRNRRVDTSLAQRRSVSTGNHLSERSSSEFVPQSLIGENDGQASLNIIGGMPVPQNVNSSDTDRFGFARIRLAMQGGALQCGGSLVAPDIVLTAAHCVGSFRYVYIYSTSESSTSNNLQSKLYIPVEILVHPQFVLETFNYDFALIRLNEAVADIHPIQLNDNPNFPILDDQLTVFGWGATGMTKPDDYNETHYEFPSTLQMASVPYVTNQLCQSIVVNGELPYQGEIFDNMLCAGNPGVDACRGDSGSPLVDYQDSSDSAERNPTMVQVGVVSWGRGCAMLPGVYSRVSYVYDWILEGVCNMTLSSSDANMPSYLACASTIVPNGVHRTTTNPAVTVNPTLAVTGAPTTAPSSTQTTPSTPPASGGNAKDSISAVVTIQLDDHSEETGWFLTNQHGQRMMQMSPGMLQNQSNQLYQAILPLDFNRSYVFVIQDLGGDGLCCRSGGGENLTQQRQEYSSGWYQVALQGHHHAGAMFDHTSASSSLSDDGSLSFYQLVVNGSGNFGARSQHRLDTFYIDLFDSPNLSDANVPTISPTLQSRGVETNAGAPIAMSGSASLPSPANSTNNNTNTWLQTGETSAASCLVRMVPLTTERMWSIITTTTATLPLLAVWMLTLHML